MRFNLVEINNKIFKIDDFDSISEVINLEGLRSMKFQIKENPDKLIDGIKKMDVMRILFEEYKRLQKEFPCEEYEAMLSSFQTLMSLDFHKTEKDKKSKECISIVLTDEINGIRFIIFRDKFDKNYYTKNYSKELSSILETFHNQFDKLYSANMKEVIINCSKNLNELLGEKERGKKKTNNKTII